MSLRGTIVVMSMALALFCPDRPATADGKDAEKRIAELKSYLGEKERSLASIVAKRRAMLKEADSLAGRVESQKEKENRSWFEQRAVEKNMARLRTRLQEIEELSGREQGVRDEALAAAAAIVAEIEDMLESDLVELRRGGENGRGRKVEGVLALEKERKIYQVKLNSLMPSLELPLDLPPGMAWTKEMIEDQRRACEASMARLQAEKELLLQEKRLRGLIRDALPSAPEAQGKEGAAGIDARIAELDRKLGLCREKLGRIEALHRGGN